MEISKLIDFNKTVGSTSTIGGEIIFSQPLKFNYQRNHTLIVHRCSIPKTLPNIYNYNGTNTGLITVSNGTDTTNIQLTDGLYSINSINNAIQSVIASWLTDTSDSAFYLRANTSIGKCYIIIDSSKLSVGSQFSIDFSGSLIYSVLGFVDTKVFNTDGTFTASDYAKINYQGDNVKVKISGLGPLSLYNGASSEYVINLNLDYVDSTNTISYPLCNSEIPFECPCRVPEYLNSLVIDFHGRDNQSIVGFDGYINLQFSIIEK